MTSIKVTHLAKIGQLDPAPWSAGWVKPRLATARQRLRDPEFVKLGA